MDGRDSERFQRSGGVKRNQTEIAHVQSDINRVARNDLSSTHQGLSPGLSDSMEAESSQAVRRAGKRPARVALSTDESETEAPRPNGKEKRRRSSLIESNDSDLDILTDEEARPQANGRRKEREANGQREEDAEEGDDEDAVDDDVDEEDGPPRPIRYRPEYDRGSDG